MVYKVLGHFGHGHFGLGRFGLDISATDVSASENAEGGCFGQNHKFLVWDVCMHKCVMHFIIFWTQICMWILTVDSKMHDNKSMLFFIETGKLWCILYSSKWLWNTCIKYPLSELVYIFCLQQFSCIFESTVHNNWWMLTTFMLNLGLSFVFKTLQIQISQLPTWSRSTLFSSLLVNTCNLITDKNLIEILCKVYKIIQSIIF